MSDWPATNSRGGTGRGAPGPRSSWPVAELVEGVGQAFRRRGSDAVALGDVALDRPEERRLPGPGGVDPGAVGADVVPVEPVQDHLRPVHDVLVEQVGERPGTAGEADPGPPTGEALVEVVRRVGQHLEHRPHQTVDAPGVGRPPLPGP